MVVVNDFTGSCMIGVRSQGKKDTILRLMELELFGDRVCISSSSWPTWAEGRSVQGGTVYYPRMSARVPKWSTGRRQTFRGWMLTPGRWQGGGLLRGPGLLLILDTFWLSGFLGEASAHN